MTQITASNPALAPARSANGIFLMLFAVLIFAAQDVVTKFLGANFHVSQILLMRFAAFAVFAAWLAHRKQGLGSTIRSKHPVQQIVRSALLTGEIALFAFIVYSMPLADLSALFAATPLIVTALSVPFLKEDVGIRRWLAVGVGFIGVLIILRPGMGVMHPYALLGIFAAFVFAIYIIMTRRLSRTDSNETSLLYLAWTGFVMSATVGPFFWVWPDAYSWMLLLTLAMTSILGHTLFVMALEVTPAAVLQPFQYTSLVWAALFGFLIFGDIPDRYTVLGAAIIVASGLYTLYRERVRARTG